MRTLLSVLAGFSLWTVLWCTSNLAAPAIAPDAFGADGSVHHAGVLGAFVALSLGFSLAAGFVTARLARARATLAASILAGVQLTIGVLVQLAYWELLPVWYHVAFLALLAPGILVGARMAKATPRRALAPT